MSVAQGSTTPLEDVHSFGLDPSFWIHRKVFVEMALRAPLHPVIPGLYLLGVDQAPFYKVEVVGVVVLVDLFKDKVKYAVDDGTGEIACVVWGEPETQPCLLELGDLCSVKGIVSSFRNVRQITVNIISPLLDPNFELLHWIQAIQHLKSATLPSSKLPRETRPSDLTTKNFAQAVSTGSRLTNPPPPPPPMLEDSNPTFHQAALPLSSSSIPAALPTTSMTTVSKAKQHVKAKFVNPNSDLKNLVFDFSQRNKGEPFRLRDLISDDVFQFGLLMLETTGGKSLESLLDDLIEDGFVLRKLCPNKAQESVYEALDNDKIASLLCSTKLITSDRPFTVESIVATLTSQPLLYNVKRASIVEAIEFMLQNGVVYEKDVGLYGLVD